jgi:hypothetical protein
VSIVPEPQEEASKEDGFTDFTDTEKYCGGTGDTMSALRTMKAGRKSRPDQMIKHSHNFLLSRLRQSPFLLNYSTGVRSV